MRKYNYDTLKGILIIFVVFAHLLMTYDYYSIRSYSIIINSIYTFHMPLFFIISGYFSRKVKKQRIIDYLFLFLFMQSSFFLYDYLKYGEMDILSIMYSSWFILLLAIYRLLICNKRVANTLLKKYSLIIIFIISIISGIIFKSLIVTRIFTFFYFFTFGYRNKFNDSKQNCRTLIIVSICLLYVVVKANVPLNLLMGASYKNVFEILIRVIIFIANTMLFTGIINIMKNKETPIISNLGKNSIYIYVFHRIPALIIVYALYPYNHYLLISIFFTIVLCLLINYLSKYLKEILQIKVLISVSIILFAIPVLLYNSNHELDIVMQDKIDNSISIGFLGDLILLEDQLKLSNNDFDYMFNNTKEYIQKTDYVFGVLEGSVDDNAEYSYGNFNDDKELRLNYPSSFLRAIENSGIEFVTIANNHIFDRGISSYNNTIENLNNCKLEYSGNKDNYKIIDIEGMKVGVLAYTYGFNYLKNSDYSDYINVLAKPYSKEFKKIKEIIHNDFLKLKKNNVDLIIVMPHYGTQFSNKIDTYQEVWNRFFIDEGADIILGDHSHTIQPVQYKGDSIIVNSPGNYINSFIEYNGDISMYVKIYISRDSHKIISSSITPIIATKDSLGRYYPVLLEDTSNKNQDRVIKLLGDVIFNNQIKTINNTYYYLKKDSYKYDNKYRLILNDNDKKSLVYQKINEHDNICFIGDSITEGTKNNQNPWYLPLMSYFNKNVINISKGSFTSYDILNEFSDKIKKSNCDLTIINIGTNDIRYNKEDVNNYINNINKIVELTNGEVIILAPWQTTSRDYNIDKNDNEKRKLYDVYNSELKKINNVYYVDPNPYIKEVINYNGEEKFLIDGIHPNDSIGIKLYSFAVLRGNNNTER